MANSITISLVTYNGARYLPACIAAVQAQTHTHWQLRILDNGSTDASAQMAAQWAAKDDRITFVEGLEQNIGFAAGHNRIMQAADTPYVLLLNQDVILANDYLEQLVFFANKKSAAALSGLLLRWQPGDDYALTPQSKTQVIDSAGLRVHRSFQVTDRYSGELLPDVSLPAEDEVFGVSGAAPLYRKAALQEVGYFNETFFSYKEDVDLAFRLQAAGQCAYLVSAARAYHHRGVGGREAAGKAATAQAHRTRPFNAKLWAYRNHWYVLLRHVSASDLLRYGVFIAWYELQKAAWLALFDRSVLWAAWRDILKNASRLRQQRRTSAVQSVRRWIQ